MTDTTSEPGRGPRLTARPAPSDSGADPRTLRKVAGAAVAGTVIEWFDFAIYGFLAPTLAATFFPAGDDLAGLMETFAVFALAFALRPLGGAFFGVIGDRVGRKHVLIATVLLMSGSTAAIGLLPGYATCGILATVLLTAARCLQGLSAGGEYAGACAYLVEHCPSHQRARYAALLPSATFASFALAALVVYALTTWLSEGAMADWGWRIPFLAAAPLGLIALLIRRHLDESPVFQAVTEKEARPHSGLAVTLRSQWRTMLRLGGFVALTALSFYAFSTYLTSFLTTVAGLSSDVALASNVAALTFAAGLAPLVGRVSDRVGRRATMYAACLALGALAFPSYWIAGHGSPATALTAQLLLALGTVAANVVTAVLLSEVFATEVRYTASAVTYNVAYALFGGTAPFVATLLIASTGSTLAPAGYITAVAVLALLAARTLPETAGRPLTDPAPLDRGR